MSQGETRVLGSLFEVCIGITDANEAISHWEHFGYRKGESGSLSSSNALKLYGVDSGLTSYRLYHQDSDHGLIRLMLWDKPNGLGLNMAPLRTVGVRWSVQKTEDMMILLNHAEVLESQNKPINWIPPIINANIHGAEQVNPKPFNDPITCLREFQVFTPLYQQIFTKRYNLELPLYGQINHKSMFRCSQVLHAGTFNKQKNLDVFDFYDKILGLKRMNQAEFKYIPNHIATRMFDLLPGDSFTMIDFDDVRSEAPFDKQISGRLRVFNINSTREEKDMHTKSKPGNLGYSLYTYRTNNAKEMYNRINDIVGDSITQLTIDEFGDKAFSFNAPDGYFWTLVERN
mgnify:FL=1